MAYIDIAEPEDACSDLRPPPKQTFGKQEYKWFVLINSDDCFLTDKVSVTYRV